MASVLERLTEGIVSRDLAKEGAALRAKWEKTGLLEGLSGERNLDNMARLLETQAKELLREVSTMAQGDVEGFAAVAFPIVRRVFGGLIANDLVSVQPMSLPSGLIFFLDFQTAEARAGYALAESLYGGGVVGQEITGGVDLGGVTLTNAESGFYNLHQGYASPTGSVTTNATAVASGTYGAVSSDTDSPDDSGITIDSLCRFDPDLVSGTATVAIALVAVSTLETGGLLLNKDNLPAIAYTPNTGSAVRRLTQYSGSDNDNILFFAVDNTGAVTPAQLMLGLTDELAYTFPLADNFAATPTAGATNAVGAVAAQAEWGLEDNTSIPEIDIKVDSVSITAVTKKLKAKWTPELGQDLNAYHNLDAEVELTSILSEQIALEIDREILADLVVDAAAGTYYWSRSPGMFLNRTTGAEVGPGAVAPDFTGNVSEWYETLVETINDVSAQIHRKVLRGGATFIVVSPEVANILEFTSGFRANVSHDSDKGTVGAIKTGNLSKKWDVYVDPYFPRNVVLVGRKGGSFLESGYVYAPYVPLQVTPTIFGIEDFVPRKGVMTRYAKKMVRPDMYGLVVVRGLLGESGGA
tara:strand:+ start:2040 stop:3785 length:1746 start_codon:yes stop_codon:yes gene_type:complete